MKNRIASIALLTLLLASCQSIVRKNQNNLDSIAIDSIVIGNRLPKQGERVFLKCSSNKQSFGTYDEFTRTFQPSKEMHEKYKFTLDEDNLLIYDSSNRIVLKDRISRIINTVGGVSGPQHFDSITNEYSHDRINALTCSEAGDGVSYTYSPSNNVFLIEGIFLNFINKKSDKDKKSEECVSMVLHLEKCDEDGVVTTETH